jgi:hypothetical protein
MTARGRTGDGPYPSRRPLLCFCNPHLIVRGQTGWDREPTAQPGPIDVAATTHQDSSLIATRCQRIVGALCWFSPVGSISVWNSSVSILDRDSEAPGIGPGLLGSRMDRTSPSNRAPRHHQ